MNDNPYAKLLSDYLVEVCLRNELACQSRDDAQFNDMVNIIYENYDDIRHYYKSNVDKDKLLTNPGGSHIVIPSQARSLACHIARTLPNNPMHNRELSYVNQYVMARSREDQPWTSR